ncbi:Cytochrome P450 monooxygenase [Colletotrichum sp. SAR 10_70]|nr:Cytochrome P450 monooxygenase [Colletotrichum sp. SAR 10_71]KAI8185575.1 Cytochrome P450 monooxygenase [Colletotrichum sp. SAR 10_70]
MPGISVPSGSTDASLLAKPYALLSIAAVVLIYAFYRWALPKPISNIPHNVSATKSVLGDIPSLMEGIKRTGEFNLWLQEQAAKFGSPLFQVFIRPLDRPTLVLCDFREAQDILMRRKEFDRSRATADLLESSAPDHHIHLKTDSEWKRHRRLLQDLMSPGFLNEVAGPAVYAGVQRLINLWNDKTRMADGRPFPAELDIYYGALDAVNAFTFGGNFPISAIQPSLEAVESLTAEDVERLRNTSTSSSKPMDFPYGECDEKITGTLDLAGAIEHLLGSPIPRIKWWFVKRRPEIVKGMAIKQAYVKEEIAKALQRLKESGNVEETKVLSAVELVVLREKKMAENEGRQPNYFSPIMIDEVFGVVIAGHDTTSTTMCWGVKLLADNPDRQTKLRDALRAGFADAAAEGRSPSIKEITSTKIHYLDATMEEILRCGGAAPLIDREAICDTELLGHHIPKGTVVMMLGKGPSMMKPAIPVDDSKRSKSSLAAKARVWDDDDVDQFKPDRWLVDGEFDQQAGPQLAFGLGTRGCFGRRLAYLELRIIVTLIVWNFELLRCPDELSGYAAKEGLTFKPKDCYVRLRALGKE